MKKLISAAFFITLLFTGIKAYSQQTASTPEFRREFLEDINHVRAKGCNCGTQWFPPAPPLVWNKQLEISAMGHAADMYHKNYFSHTSKDGRSMEDRIALAGYTFNGYKSFMIGENIAMGQLSIAEVMQGWFKSEGHCHNLMNPGFKEVGVALTHNYWVQDFGGRETFSAEQERLIRSGKARIIEGH